MGRDPTQSVADNLREAEGVFRPLVDRAGDLGVKLIVENCVMEGWHPDGYPGNLAYSPELWEWMFDLGLYLNYDPSHLVWMGIDPVAALRPYIDHIPHAQAKDIEIDAAARNRYGWPGRAAVRDDPWDVGWWRYRVPGLGQVDWVRLVDALYEGGFDGVLSVEHEDPVWGGTEEKVEIGLRDRAPHAAAVVGGVKVAVTNPILEVRGLVKEYPGVRALAGVDFEVRPGEVHCLVGPNGAGKSTLIKCVSGAVEPTEGQILMDGQPTVTGDPSRALENGVATIYQERDLVEDLTVAQSIFLGHELRRWGLLDRGRMRREVVQLLRRLNHEGISPRTYVRDLRPAGQQVVSIARALSRHVRLLIMDEPSAILDDSEIETMFGIVRRLTAEGVGVIYISHRLDEIRRLGDRVTVLSDGRTVASGLPATTPADQLVERMVGRKLEQLYPERPARRRQGRPGGQGRAAAPRRQACELRGPGRRGARHRRAGRRRAQRAAAGRLWRRRPRRRRGAASTAGPCRPAGPTVPSPRVWAWPRRIASLRPYCSTGT